MKPLKILLADDHEMIIDGLRSLLEGEEDLEIIGDVSDGEQVLQRISFSPQPDLLIMDINMPNKDGIETTLEVKQKYPKVKIIILSMHNRSEFIKKLIAAGADGYILKNSGRKEILSAIRTVASGKKYFDAEIMKTEFEERMNPENTAILSDREKEVVKLIATGYSTVEIADRLNISTHTVDSHRKKIFQKLGLKNIAEITLYALRVGIVKGFEIS